MASLNGFTVASYLAQDAVLSPAPEGLAALGVVGSSVLAAET